MINTATVQYIDVSRRYFEVETISTTVRWYIFEKESDGEISMNHVISKPYAKKKAVDIYETLWTEVAQLYISSDAVKVKQIKDYMGEPIFRNLDEDLSGWLFFFDPLPFANWEHPCSYLFLIDESNYEMVAYERGLCDAIQTEKIY